VERSWNTSEPTSVSSVGRRRPSWRRIGLIAVVVVCVTFLVLEILFAVSAASQSGCGLCHVPSQAAEDLTHSSHGENACKSCHKLPGISGTVRYNLQAADHFVTWLTRRPTSSGGQARPLDLSACTRCHEGLAQGVVTVDGVRMSHKQVMESVEGNSPGTDIPCTGCHARVAHTPAPGSVASLDPHSTCVACHDGFTASKECKTCHTGASSTQLAAGTTPTDPHPAGWDVRHGMGDQSTCSLCHPSAYCQDCHKVALPHDPETYIYTHGTEAVSAGEACLACHSQSSCEDCHKMPMPHSTDYLQLHGQDAADRGSGVCVGCHAPDGCDTCHERHIHPGVPDSVKEKLAAQSSRLRESVSTTSTTSTTNPGP
jgi:hypothetical protein